jgi:ketosteroid isomerase-like protein
MKTFAIIVSVLLFSAAAALAQNSNTTSPSSRGRTVAAKPSPTPKTVTKSPDATQTTSSTTGGGRATTGPSATVLSAFDKIMEGIRRANVDMVTKPYWNSAALVLFNYNGTVTRGWDQMRKNRETSYPNMKDVKLDIRDKHVVMLGRDGAVVTCLWTQSMTFNGKPETDTGRMTLVFKRVGTEWKAVHLHTSQDNPDPSRVPTSEQSP